MPRVDAIERSPLCPASPPPSRIWKPPGLEIDVVVDDEQGVGRDFEEPRRGADRLAGHVHVGLRLEQGELALAVADFRDLSRELRAKGAVVPSGELVRDQPADVVPRARVLPPRVAQAGDEQIECRGALAPTKEAH